MQDWVRFVQVWCFLWEGFRSRIGWGLCGFDACMRRIKTQEFVRFVQVWCVYEKDSGARVGEVCAGLMQTWEGFICRSGWGLRRFDASMRRIQMQVWVRFVQVWCSYEKDLDAGVGEVCAVLMLVWEGFRGTIGWGLCRFDAWMRKTQAQECVRFMQVWFKHEKDSDPRVGEVCAGLIQEWEGFWCKSEWGLCRFDACMRRIQTQDWVRFVQVWCVNEKDSGTGVREVCAGLMQAWEGFRRRSGWGLCRFDACMRRIQTQEFVRFGRVWCVYEKDSGAGVSEVCAGLIQAWEGFWPKNRWGLCMFDSSMRRILMQDWVRFVQVWCFLWEGFRSRIGWGLCGFDACMRRIKTQEFVRFVQVWCVYEKDSGAGVGEVCAGLMQTWEGFICRSGWGLRRFDASMRRIQMQVWVRFVQVWCSYEKDLDAGVGEVCAVLMLVWEWFRGTINWGLCRFDTCLRRIQTQEWARFEQVWCLYEKSSVAGVGEIFAGWMQAWERFRRRSGWGLRRFDASMRRIQMQEWLRFVQVWCSYEKDLDAGVSEVCAGLVHAWEGFRRKSGWG